MPVKLALGAKVRVLWLKEELGWQPDTDELRRAITPNTKLVALCNPNNPTGATLSEHAMTDITMALEKTGAVTSPAPRTTASRSVRPSSRWR